MNSRSERWPSGQCLVLKLGGPGETFIFGMPNLPRLASVGSIQNPTPTPVLIDRKFGLDAFREFRFFRCPKCANSLPAIVESFAFE